MFLEWSFIHKVFLALLEQSQVWNRQNRDFVIFFKSNKSINTHTHTHTHTHSTHAHTHTHGCCHFFACYLFVQSFNEEFNRRQGRLSHTPHHIPQALESLEVFIYACARKSRAGNLKVREGSATTIPCYTPS